MFNFIYKHVMTALIVLSYGLQRLHDHAESLSQWYMDIIFYHGKTGLITWAEIEDEYADGYITVREVVDGEHLITKINFRVANRWMVRGGRNPGQAFLFKMRSHALEAGWPVIAAYWYTDTCAVVERKLMDVSAPAAKESRLTGFLRGLAGRVDHIDNSIDAQMREDLMRRVVRRA
ncbi:hypothetical protein [Stenotrophomonas sp. GD03657]|uniref:hypothetical protein n=1 Tax=Stenotrophomonas sp. GD03657 TaxID=2975363 RepID=UPI002449EFC2|nr:hypothetical protein [Stenotrophomonas sp. GD03657]MDH2154170.1 hypothetical protein [Stenotrophomonas sp. GD03657]